MQARATFHLILFCCALSYGTVVVGQTTRQPQQPRNLPAQPQSAPVSNAGGDTALSGLPAHGATVTLNHADRETVRNGGIDIASGHAVLRIEALRDNVLRIRVAPEGTMPEDASWAVPAELRSTHVSVQRTSDAQSFGFATSQLKVRVGRNDMRTIITDKDGTVLNADAPYHPIAFQNGAFHVYKQLPASEHFFGLGDKTGPLDRRGQAFSNWNTDAFGFQESTDPIYKTIPFFLSVNGGRSYGIFLDNTWRSSFDFGRADSTAYSFGSIAGPLDYYFIYGPEPKGVVQTYTDLTGKPPLPPLWSFGYQQSRYSYAPENKLRDVAARLRWNHIPCDVLWLDIDFQNKNRPFTVDPVGFPDFPKLISDMDDAHYKVITITDLHVAKVANADYQPYDTGSQHDEFVHNPDGSVFVGKVWPGPSVFPDFTRQQSREWWGTQFKQFVDWHVAGFWNDMNEPSVFDGPEKTMPLNTVHRIDEPGFHTRKATHAEIHNIYGLQNARATYEGVLKLRPDERPFVMTRASYAGGQRYGVTWTGDNSATWNHLRMSSTMLLNLGLSGFSFAGADVGGFAGSPQPELLTRWLALAAFQPIDRDHSAKGTNDQEPWVNGAEHEKIRRNFIEARYRLLPYIYTTAEETSRTGIPLMRPLFLEFPHATEDGHPVDLNAGSEFMLGPDLLVAPAPYPDMVDKYFLTLPGKGWYDFWTGKQLPPLPSEADILAGTDVSPDGTTAQSPEMQKRLAAILAWRITPTLDKLPVYVRSGSVIPMQPLVQSTAEKPQGPLELRVYPGENCHGSMYLDDGHTLRYQHGEYLRQSFTCEAAANGGVHLQIAKREGSFAPWWNQLRVTVYGATKQAKTIRLASGNSSDLQWRAASESVSFVIPDNAEGNDVRIEY